MADPLEDGWKATLSQGITIGLGETPPGTAGYWDPDLGTVVISSTADKVLRHVTLLHELLHITEDTCVVVGVIPERLPHDFIQTGSWGLLLMLVEAGVWQGVTREEVITYGIETGQIEMGE